MCGGGEILNEGKRHVVVEMFVVNIFYLLARKNREITYTSSKMCGIKTNL